MLVDYHPDSSVRLVALGGLGEIGLNCLCIETHDHALLVDCGVSFPSSDLGIDVYYPDFSYLTNLKKTLVAVLITHGHEDHIGAVPFLLRYVNVPIYGSCHAIGLISERISDRNRNIPFDICAEQNYPAYQSPSRVQLTVIQPNVRVKLGPFDVEAISVTHSISGAFCYAIRCENKLIVHTGDFKFDDHPADGICTNIQRLRELGEEGVDLLLSDSTNIDIAGVAGSEAQVAAALREAILSCDKRVVVGLFSSNLHRLHAIGQIAQQTGRNIGLLGYSVQMQVKIATNCGLLRWPSNLLVSSDHLASLDRERCLVIAGGTQGESVAALSRLSTRSHQQLSLSPNDLLIMSSRVIPGNDPAVLQMICNFLRQQVQVISRFTHPSIHVSGHACRDEQKRMIQLIRPKSFMPIHGTLHHLTRHAQLAKELAVTDVIVAENGDIVQLDSEGLKRINYAHIGRIATFCGEPVADSVIRQRDLLAHQGAVMVTLFANSRGTITDPIIMSTTGVIAEQSYKQGRDEQVSRRTDEAKQRISELITSTGFAQRPTDKQLMEATERAVQRTFDDLTGRRPVVVVHVVRT